MERHKRLYRIALCMMQAGFCCIQNVWNAY